MQNQGTPQSRLFDAIKSANVWQVQQLVNDPVNEIDVNKCNLLGLTPLQHAFDCLDNNAEDWVHSSLRQIMQLLFNKGADVNAGPTPLLHRLVASKISRVEKVEILNALAKIPEMDFNCLDSNNKHIFEVPCVNLNRNEVVRIFIKNNIAIAAPLNATVNLNLKQTPSSYVILEDSFFYQHHFFIAKLKEAVKSNDKARTQSYFAKACKFLSDDLNPIYLYDLEARNVLHQLLRHDKVFTPNVINDLELNTFSQYEAFDDGRLWLKLARIGQDAKPYGMPDNLRMPLDCYIRAYFARNKPLRDESAQNRLVTEILKDNKRGQLINPGSAQLLTLLVPKIIDDANNYLSGIESQRDTDLLKALASKRIYAAELVLGYLYMSKIVKELPNGLHAQIIKHHEIIDLNVKANKNKLFTACDQYAQVNELQNLVDDAMSPDFAALWKALAVLNRKSELGDDHPIFNALSVSRDPFSQASDAWHNLVKQATKPSAPPLTRLNSTTVSKQVTAANSISPSVAGSALPSPTRSRSNTLSSFMPSQFQLSQSEIDKSTWKIDQNAWKTIAPLFGAIKKGVIDDVRKLLDKNSDSINARSPSGLTPLQYAVKINPSNAALLKLLMEKGADVNAGPSQVLPHLLLDGNYDSTVALLGNTEIDVNQFTVNGQHFTDINVSADNRRLLASCVFTTYYFDAAGFPPRHRSFHDDTFIRCAYELNGFIKIKPDNFLPARSYQFSYLLAKVSIKNGYTSLAKEIYKHSLETLWRCKDYLSPNNSNAKRIIQSLLDMPEIADEEFLSLATINSLFEYKSLDNGLIWLKFAKNGGVLNKLPHDFPPDLSVSRESYGYIHAYFAKNRPREDSDSIKFLVKHLTKDANSISIMNEDTAYLFSILVPKMLNDYAMDMHCKDSDVTLLKALAEKLLGARVMLIWFQGMQMAATSVPLFERLSYPEFVEKPWRFPSYEFLNSMKNNNSLLYPGSTQTLHTFIDLTSRLLNIYNINKDEEIAPLILTFVLSDSSSIDCPRFFKLISALLLKNYMNQLTHATEKELNAYKSSFKAEINESLLNSLNQLLQVDEDEKRQTPKEPKLYPTITPSISVPDSISTVSNYPALNGSVHTESDLKQMVDDALPQSTPTSTPDDSRLVPCILLTNTYAGFFNAAEQMMKFEKRKQGSTGTYNSFFNAAEKMRAFEKRKHGNVMEKTVKAIQGQMRQLGT